MLCPKLLARDYMAKPGSCGDMAACVRATQYEWWVCISSDNSRERAPRVRKASGCSVERGTFCVREQGSVSGFTESYSLVSAYARSWMPRSSLGSWSAGSARCSTWSALTAASGPLVS